MVVVHSEQGLVGTGKVKRGDWLKIVIPDTRSRDGIVSHFQRSILHKLGGFPSVTPKAESMVAIAGKVNGQPVHHLESNRMIGVVVVNLIIVDMF